MTAPQIATSPVGFDAGAVLARLRTSFESGRTRTVEWRREQLTGLRRMLTERGTSWSRPSGPTSGVRP
jgi:aldehyde dehydrogenase (NAD+)